MLFRLAQWHALAKLRVHTGSTLDMLRNITSELGRELRKFRDKTRAAYFPQQSGGSTTARGSRKNKTEGPINLLTYKFHALGDYETTIRTFGITDSYTTQIVSIFTVCIADPDVQLYLGRTSTPTGQTILRMAHLCWTVAHGTRTELANVGIAARQPLLRYSQLVSADD
jgi:hypothetical protein